MRITSAFETCWSIRASSTLMGVFALNLPAKNPVSNRLNHGSSRIVLLPKVISHPSVPNHLKFTPAEPGPPLLGAGSAPSATPGSRSDLPKPSAVPATPAASPPPRNWRRETPGGTRDSEDVSKKHIEISFLCDG